MQHSAIYYDGQASKPHQAQVEVFGNSLSIYYDEKKVIWVISEIQYAEFSGKDKTMLKYGAFPHQYLEYHNEGSLSQNLQGYLPKPDNSFGVVAREYNALIKVTLIGISVFTPVLLFLIRDESAKRTASLNPF